MVRKIQFDSSEVVMRLLKRHPDETDADELGGEEVRSKTAGSKDRRKNRWNLDARARPGAAGAGEP